MTTDLRPDPALAARAAAEAPAMALDPEAVLVAAHRRVRRRRAGALAWTGSAVAVVVALAAASGGIHRPDSGPFSRATTSSAGRVTTVADGLEAVAAVAAPHAPDPVTGIPASLYSDYARDREASVQVDLGLTAGPAQLALIQVPAATDGVSTALLLALEDPAPIVTSLVWPAPASAALEQAGSLATADGGQSAFEPLGDDVVISVVVPPGLAHPHVLLGSTADLRLADGTTTHTVELPTFETPAGRLLSVAVASPPLAAALTAGQTAAVIVDAHGTVLLPCHASGEQTCPNAAQIPGLVDAVRGLGGRVQVVGSPAPNATDTAAGKGPAPATIAAGIVAAVGPFTGSTVGGGAGSSIIDLGTLSGAALSLLRDAPDNDSRVELTATRGDGTDPANVARVALGAPGGSGVYHAMRGDQYGATSVCFDDSTRGCFWVGVAPPDATRVFLTRSWPIVLPDGSSTNVVEVPTFTLPDFAGNPLSPDRRWFLLDDTETPPDSGESDVVFGRAPDVIVDPTCTDGAACGGIGDTYAQVRALLAR